MPSFETWVAACRRLPTNRELGMRPIPRALLPLKSYRDFAAVLDPLLDQQRTGPLSRPEAWLGSPPPASFLDLAVMTPPEGQAPFLPFAQRHALPEGARVFLMGDLHGDIHSLLTYLEQLNQRGVLQGFKLTAAADRLAFLGDYTDRGRFGVEVLYTLLRLRLANPDRVLLARGNHEDVLLLSRYGFVAEVMGKYGKEWDLRRTARFFDFLPAVLYLGHGTNWIQCNHGGMEPGYDPARLIAASEPALTYQLLGRLDQRRWLTQEASWVARLPAETRREMERSLTDFVPESPTTPTVLGFMWNDFTVLPSDPQFGIDPGRAFVYGSETSRRVLARSAGPEGRVRALFRGHQHAMVLNPLMRRLMASRGLYRHWQESDHVSLLEAAPAALQAKLEVGEERPIPEGSVWTFNVSPDSMYGAGCGYDFGTYGELVPASLWEAWRIKVHTFEPLEAARERSP
ncbi:MAG: serine/threonine protein phosphatase [Verrucomicrobiales bacterium]|nr:serine/threonine protein phosphatase [Verrucomicrobiales bacterium]